MNAKLVSVHDIQLYLANNLLLHPKLADAYEKNIFDMERMGTISILPHVILERFTKKMLVRRQQILDEMY